MNLNSFSKAEFPFTDRLNLSVNYVGHKLPEDSRNIRKFKFAVIFEDEYGDLILEIFDLEFDPKYPIMAPSEGVVSSSTLEYGFSYDFNRHNEKSMGFEKLSRFRERKAQEKKFHDIKIRYNITSVIFEDGEVLKK